MTTNRVFLPNAALERIASECNFNVVETSVNRKVQLSATINDRVFTGGSNYDLIIQIIKGLSDETN